MEQLKELREKVIKANELYDELRAVIHIPDDEPFQREGIKILSEPFVKGVFTLAVIGQMTSGKSAFINALLEDEDILPTGHFQTTCTLTEIVWSTIKRLQVTYGDGHIEEFNGDEIIGKLKEVAAINPKFESLPINHINEFILKGQGIKDILNNKELIIKLSGRPTIDEELLKEYVLGNHKEGIEAKNRSTIPVHVYMEYPLAESYRGWRIVDTPGIGALGGIDQTTKDFLANEQVDGAIFMFNGAEPIGRNDLSEMVKRAYSQLTDVAKERTFFVITHAGESACRSNIERTFKNALELFSQGDVAIPRDRFFAVDSMLSLLYDCAITRSNLDPMIFQNIGVNIQGMDRSDIKMYKNMVIMLLEELADEQKELNTENLNKKIVEVAGFAALKQALGCFARDAKMQAFAKLRETIVADFKSFGSKKTEEKELWNGKLTKTPEEFKQELELKKKEIEKYRVKMIKKYTDIIFSYDPEVLATMFERSYKKFEKKIDVATTFAEIDNAYNNFQDMFPIEEELVMTKFTRDCQKLGDIEISSEFPTICLPPIDIEEAKRIARKDATTKKLYLAKVKKKGIVSGIKRLFGQGGYDYEARYYDEIDDKKELANYQSELKSKVIKSISSYCEDLCESYILPTGQDIQKQLGKLVEQKNNEYDKIKNNLASAQEIANKIIAIDSELEKISEYNEKVLTTTNIA